ncbi:hypothetical protein MASR1M74_23860 [Lentimicrobium sp.]
MDAVWAKTPVIMLRSNARVKNFLYIIYKIRTQQLKTLLKLFIENFVQINGISVN